MRSFTIFILRVLGFDDQRNMDGNWGILNKWL
jgi:hypothetical protein